MDRRGDMNFDFDEFARRHARRWGITGIALVAIGLVTLVGLWTMYYTVQPEGEAVVKRFGRVVRTTGPGLHFKWPFGIETATFVPTRRVLKEEFGFRTTEAAQRSQYRKRTPEQHESLMLTGDLSVIDVEWVVQYQINDSHKWLHQARDPRETIRDVSEAVMRRIVGNRLGSDALTEARSQIAAAVKQEMQSILEDGEPGGDDYGLGIHIGTVQMQDVTPPDPVKPAFNEVNKSRQEKERLINEAERYRNQVIPKARGEAEQTIAEAEAYRAERVNAAKGEASRFAAMLTEYQEQPMVTRRRLYLEMVDQVLPKVGRVYVVEQEGHQPLPLLNLDRIADEKGAGH
ncbi:MAG: FtsH protease activity modulator HflK [Phycisphaeraceae bacterium]